MPANKIISLDSTNLRRRVKRIVNNINANGSATASQSARLVAVRAAILAPGRTTATGQTAQFIKVINTSKDGVTSYNVGFENQGFGVGNPHPEKRWMGTEFSLPLWMHTSNKAFSHPWKTGVPNFLTVAAIQTQEEFRNRIRKVVRNALSYKVK